MNVQLLLILFHDDNVPQRASLFFQFVLANSCPVLQLFSLPPSWVVVEWLLSLIRALHVCSVTSVMHNSLPPNGLYARLLSPWNSPRQEYWSGLHALLKGFFPTQGLNRISYVSCKADGFFTAEPMGKSYWSLNQYLTKSSILYIYDPVTTHMFISFLSHSKTVLMSFIYYIHPTLGFGKKLCSDFSFYLDIWKGASKMWGEVNYYQSQLCPLD